MEWLTWMGSTVKQPTRTFWRGRDLVEDGAGCQAVLLQLVAHQADGQPGGIDRHIELPQQVGQAADVILVAVGDEQSLDAVLVLQHVGEIRDDQVDAEHFVIREHRAAVPPGSCRPGTHTA